MGSNDSTDELQDSLAQVEAAFSGRLPEQVEALTAAWAEACNQAWRARGLEHLMVLASQVADAAEAFGLDETGAAVRNLEAQFGELSKAGEAPDDDLCRAIDDRLDQLRLAAEEFSAADRRGGRRQNLAPAAVRRIAADKSPRLILVATANAPIDELTEPVRSEGYEPVVLSSWADVSAEIEDGERPPAGVIAYAPDVRDGDLDELWFLEFDHDLDCPLVLVGRRDDMASRILAAKLGALAYLPLPASGAQIAAAVAAMHPERGRRRHRVLIVDDSVFVAKQLAATLRYAGIEVALEHDPMQIAAALVEFRPDLVLLDYTMPECNGLAVAAALRRNPAYAHVPLLLMASAADARLRELEALELVDGIVSRPVDPLELTHAVLRRIAWQERLGAEELRDPLTGLYAAGEFERRVHRELIRSARLESPLSLAVFDLVDLSGLNAAEGHLAGDRAIQSLAGFATSYFRETDVVGRSREGDVAVLLTDAGRHDATDVVREALARFNRGAGRVGRGTRGAAVAARLATFPPADSAAALWRRLAPVD